MNEWWMGPLEALDMGLVEASQLRGQGRKRRQRHSDFRIKKSLPYQGGWLSGYMAVTRVWVVQM